MNPDELERQNVDTGTIFFNTEEEARAYLRAFNLEHEAVLKGVAEALREMKNAGKD